MTLQGYKKRFSRLSLQREATQALVSQEESSLQEARQRLQDALQAQRLTQEVAGGVQRAAHDRICRVVSRCLVAVFGEDAYEFRIDFCQKRGKTEAHLLFVRDGCEVDPTEAAGGGVVDVAALALRLACLVLARPGKRLFLALDEPLRFLSKNHHDRAADLLLTLCQELGLQILMVTHEEELQVGKVIRL